MSIVSPVRTARIIEEVADKHGLDVRAMLCAAWKRDFVLARAEVVHRLRSELSLSYRAIGEKLGLTAPGVRKLFSSHKKREAQARLFAPLPDPDGRIRELEAELARLSGAMLCEKLAERLDLKMRLAICLAIVTEAYPRFVRGPALPVGRDHVFAHFHSRTNSRPAATSAAGTAKNSTPVSATKCRLRHALASPATKLPYRPMNAHPRGQNCRCFVAWAHQKLDAATDHQDRAYETQHNHRALPGRCGSPLALRLILGRRK